MCLKKKLQKYGKAFTSTNHYSREKQDILQYLYLLIMINEVKVKVTM
jgi:hypothetical protein